ncbi:hypothetical protein [Sphingomonas endophytica]|uniref:hypothetical protein n=1 Tax=Sphingomonas endophytica TaxID=869719 RepID=UPI00128FC037|nr:hypothetical protein [Sphingomonas endophytica]
MNTIMIARLSPLIRRVEPSNRAISLSVVASIAPGHVVLNTIAATIGRRKGGAAALTNIYRPPSTAIGQ